MNVATSNHSGIRTRAARSAMPLRSGVHYSNKGGKNIPFSTQNRIMLPLKVAVFCGIGFGAAFLPGQWQNFKARRG
ncbi:hypothetical protein B0O80DRAFT_450799 [Mortierella sp. GBAus27b]|nr:hypothetical protein B0O80DRAFT_450799 [Mortierella sp. GBAus27b]